MWKLIAPQGSKSNSCFSYSLDFFGNYDGVLLADLGRRFGLVVVRTVVLVGVTVKSAEQVSTATVEPWNGRKGKAVLEEAGHAGARVHLLHLRSFSFVSFFSMSPHFD